jgi:hypothetical protein
VAEDHEIFALPRRSSWVKVTCVIPAEVFPLFDTVRSNLEGMGVRHNIEQVQNGMVLEIVCAEWLASSQGGPM